MARAPPEKRRMNFAPRTITIPAVNSSAFAVAVEPAFDFASANYRALHARSQASAFQAPRWMNGLYRDVAPALAAESAATTVRDADGRLLLLLPLVRRRERGITLLEFADFGICDYLGAVYDPGDAPRLLADASLPQQIADALPPHDLLELTKLPGGDPLLDHLFPRVRRAQMRFSAYPAQLQADWKAWRKAKLDNSFRRYLDMKRRRLERTDTPAFTLLDEPARIGEAFAAMRRYRVERFKAIGGQDALDNDAIYDFYLRIATEGAHDGSARTHCLSVAGEPIAVIFGLVQRGTYSLLLVGFDAMRHARLSPGLLALEDTVRAAIEAGDTVYDFTIGDHAYKLQFGAEAMPLHEWHKARTIRGHVALLNLSLVRETKRTFKPAVALLQKSVRDLRTSLRNALNHANTNAVNTLALTLPIVA